MTDVTLSTPDLDSLRASFRGELILPDDAAYDERRHLFNTLHEKRPAVIARCAGTHDVVEAIRYARAAGLEIAVRSGGTHMAGFASSDGGLVVDLSLMHAVKVDPDARTAWVQAGARGGDLQAEAQVHGLGAATGWTADVGVGGVALHGGWGMLSSKLGWGSEAILELELVTADGEVLRASADENPDLFWALRGAAGNFGVVTWIKVRLTPVPEAFLAGSLIYDAAQAPELLRFLNEFAKEASEDLTFFGELSVLPADPSLPEELHGKAVMAVTLVHVGELAQAEEDLRPLREGHPPLLDGLAHRALLEYMCELNSYVPPSRQWYDGEQVTELSSAVIDTIVEQAQQFADQGLSGVLQVIPMGRARVEDLPFGRTPDGWGIGPVLFWEDSADDEKHAAWSNGVCAAVRDAGLATGRVYGNIQQVPDAERLRRSLGDARWQRLTALKAKYDPENVFHLNHNIPPAA